MSSFGNLLKPLFGVSEQFTTFNEEDQQAAQRLKVVVGTVTKGCQITLQSSTLESSAKKLNAFEVELRGYAYEGAGIALAALDSVLPWGNRTRAFLKVVLSASGTGDSSCGR